MIKRLLAGGIFVTENLNHVANFNQEVQTLVAPALSPLPPSIAVFVHALTVGLGLLGSTLFVAGGNRHSRLALGFLAVFMVLITWTWWFRRTGEFVWEVVDNEERRMRIIHCLKNLSIFGFILCLRDCSLTEVDRIKRE